ncbi:MAG TPA: hypothetical protein VG895_04665 [Patescibacteria group bacterium]|nr:hypothetical protein [Patescibacteria group bacterium]
MAKTEEERIQEELDKLQVTKKVIRDSIGGLSPFFMGLAAESLGLEKTSEGDWTEEEYFEALEDFDTEKAGERAQKVGMMINSLGEELSEEDQQIPEWQLLFAAFNEINDKLVKFPQIVDDLFSERMPIFLSVDLWRKASFLSHMAWRYQEQQQATKQPIEWLRSKDIEIAWNENHDIGISELYQKFMDGYYD